MSPRVKKAFEEWINTNSWHTGHDLDKARFYRFVWSIFTFSRKSPDASSIRNEILKRWEDRLEAKYLQEKAIHYSQLLEVLYEFAMAKNAGRPFLIDPKTRGPIL